MVKRLQINSDVLLSYIESSGIAFATLQEKVKDIDQFVGGEKMPTFTQKKKIAKGNNCYFLTRFYYFIFIYLLYS